MALSSAGVHRAQANEQATTHNEQGNGRGIASSVREEKEEEEEEYAHQLQQQHHHHHQHVDFPYDTLTIPVSTSHSGAPSPLARSLSSLSPSAYSAGSSPAFKKMSFIDDRRATLAQSAKILSESVQEVYSHSNAGSLLPGARNAPPTQQVEGGEIVDTSLSRAELEQQRRARIFAYKPFHIAQATTAFSQTAAAVEAQPDLLLSSTNATHKYRAKHEKKMEEAARQDALAYRIINQIKNASVRHS